MKTIYPLHSQSSKMCHATTNLHNLLHYRTTHQSLTCFPIRTTINSTIMIRISRHFHLPTCLPIQESALNSQTLPNSNVVSYINHPSHRCGIFTQATHGRYVQSNWVQTSCHPSSPLASSAKASFPISPHLSILWFPIGFCMIKLLFDYLTNFTFGVATSSTIKINCPSQKASNAHNWDSTFQ